MNNKIKSRALETEETFRAIISKSVKEDNSSLYSDLSTKYTSQQINWVRRISNFTFNNENDLLKKIKKTNRSIMFLQYNFGLDSKNRFSR